MPQLIDRDEARGEAVNWVRLATLVIAVAAPVVFGLALAIQRGVLRPLGWREWLAAISATLVTGGAITAGFLSEFRTARRTDRLEQRTAELQENLDENFRLNLIKINFKYIDKYYFQTQSQANKSFMLSLGVAIVAFGILLFGISQAYEAGSDKTAGYVATFAGVLSQFIAAVFFYLYNRTVLKMSEYHQKLVLTQNIALALKITDELEGQSKTDAQLKLIDYLAKDVNVLLATRSSEAGITKPAS